MFDGNFRSRKEVNLSSGASRRRRGTTEPQSKQSLLRNAETQRRKRQEHQRKLQAARTVQRCARGWLARLHILEELLPTACQSLTVTSHIVYHFRSFLSRQNTSVERILLDYSKQSAAEAVDAMDLGSSHKTNSTGVSCNAVVDDFSASTLWLSRKRLVEVMLEKFTPDSVPHEHERIKLFALLKKEWQIFRSEKAPDGAMFLVLSKCLSRWIGTTAESATTNANEIVETLCQWAIQIGQSLPNPHCRALLSSILLSGHMSRISLLPGNLYDQWVVPLAEALDAPDSENPILHTTKGNLQNGKGLRLLSNLLENNGDLLATVQEPGAILKLIFHSLQSDDDLSLMTTLLVRGDSLETTKGTAENSMDLTQGDDSDDEDYDDGENNKEASSTPPPSLGGNATKKARPSSRLARKDLLTLQKLDKIYQEAIQQQKRDCKSLGPGPSNIEMAQKLVRAPWLAWGLKLLDGDESHERVSQLYVAALGFLMQSLTGLRPTTKVGVMSPLAFNKGFMLKLWKHILSCATDNESLASHRDLSLAVFCDLFAHYLVALSDVDFLRFHTNVEVSSDLTVSSADGVMAVEVIGFLRDVLHDLYWAQPVLVHEVASRSERGRLLLSGTKVWNSLYERWNRLVRNKSFCDASAWWFPHLSSKEGDRAVVPTRQRGAVDTDTDAMDIDENDESDDESDFPPLSAAEAETDALADAFKDPKMARILTYIPQALPFTRRVNLFHSLLKADKQKIMEAASSRQAMMAMNGGEVEPMFFDGIARERVRIRRAKLYDDSMQQLNDLGSKLKHRVQVSFVNQHGTEEAGIDGGGVFKEFLDDLIKDGFASASDGVLTSDAGAPPLFSVTPMQTLTVNLALADNPKMLEHYEFLGRVLGKAVYESILVEPQFCLPFLNQLLGKTNTMEDLKNYDEEYYMNLNKLKMLNDSEVEALGLSFEVTVGRTTEGSSALPKTVELMPGGRTVLVKNRAQVFSYMHAVANQLLNVQGARQTKAFLRGFRDLIPASWVRLFSANELQNLISGDDSVRGIDVPSLKRSINYLGGYHPSQPYIQDFWDIVENELSPDQQRSFLRFMTSCSRQPLLGFSSLDPAPAIQQIRLTDEELSKNSKLPMAQTCFNLLKLPNYKNRALLKEKLLAAIESGAGFELT